MRFGFRLCVVALATVSIVSCDLSTWLIPADDDGQTPDTLEIRRFWFEAARNPELSEDIEGVVQPGRVDVSLPYEVVSGNMLLEPTIELPANVSIFPEDDQPFGDEVNYTIENLAGDTAVYRVFPAIDPDTLTLMNVGDPFYVNGADKIPVSSYSIVRRHGEFILEVPIEDLPTYSGREIGFEQVAVPQGSTGDLEPAVFGDAMPYNVAVVSRDGRYTTDYHFSIRNQQTTNTDLADVTATVREVYDWSGAFASNSASWSSWQSGIATITRNPVDSNQGEGSITSWNGWTAMRADITHFRRHHAWTLGVGSTTTGKTYGSPSLTARIWMENQRGSAADKADIDAAVASRPAQTGVTVGSPLSTTIEPVFTNDGFSYPAPSGNVYDTGSMSRTFDWEFRVQVYSLADFGRPPETTGVASETFTATWQRNRTYTSRDYYVVDQVVAEVPLGATVEDLYVFPLVSSHQQNGQELIFDLVDTAPSRTVGAIAVFNVIAEDGTSGTHSLVIEE